MDLKWSPIVAIFGVSGNSGPGLCLARQQPCLAISVELIADHGDCIDTCIEPCAPQTAGTGKKVPFLREHEIGKLPRREAFKRARLQAMPRHDPVPDRPLVGHPGCELHMARYAAGDTKPLRQQRPDLAPAKTIAVGDVERRVLS